MIYIIWRRTHILLTTVIAEGYIRYRYSPYDISLLKYYFYALQVENLVSIELSYINTNHPDFTDGASVVSAMLASTDLVSHYAFIT